MMTQSLQQGQGSQQTWLSRNQALLLLAVYSILVLIRVPSILSHGRFWAEEGESFYRNAATLPPLQALFHAFGGYLNLPTNAATLIARYIAPLEYAPYVTTFFGFLGQLLPAILIVQARDAWLQNPVVRAAALAAILFAPSNNEIWLQSLHLQLQIDLCCCIILALDPVGGVLRRCLIIMAPLGGPGAVVLVPLFFLRALIDRSKPRFFDAILMLIPSIIQFTVFCSDSGGRGQQSWFGPGLVAVFCREPFTLMFGHFSATLHATVPILQNYETVHPNSLSWAHLALVATFLPFAIGSLVWPRCRSILWLLLSNATFTGAAMFGAIGGSTTQISLLGGDRYFYVGQALFLLMVLSFAANAERNVYRVLAGLAMAWMLFLGQQQYWYRSYVQNSAYRSVWSTEVKNWRQDHHYGMRIWPDPWRLNLK